MNLKFTQLQGMTLSHNPLQLAFTCRDTGQQNMLLLDFSCGVVPCIAASFAEESLF